MKFLMAAVFAAALFFFQHNSAFAQNNAPDPPPDNDAIIDSEPDNESAGSPYEDADDDDVYIMEGMHIIEKVRSEDAGTTEIPRELIKSMPRLNGNMTDLLRIAPSVQFDEKYRSSENAGEIAPAEISISGGRAYENLFLLDGMSNSNMLDPAAKDPYETGSQSRIYSGTQKFSVDSSIIEDITVYSSNIPVTYDGFTGGVVDVKTKLPGDEIGMSISYRTTRSGWTNYFTEDTEKYLNFGGGSLTPRFVKHFYSASFNLPVSANTGFILSYNRKESTIPVAYFNGWKDSTRLEQTYFLKGVHNIDGSNYVDLSLGYMPSESARYIANVKDSRYIITGGGYYAAANYNREVDQGKLHINASYSRSQSSRESPNEYKAWIASRNKPWGAMDVDPGDLALSREGGYGSIDEDNYDIALALDQTFNPVNFAGQHQFSYGLKFGQTWGRYNRLADAIYYDGVATSVDIICAGDTNTCVDGDQYFKQRRITPASDLEVTINTYSGYIEDSWDIARLNLRLGLRVTNDDYMNNTNFAPRTKAELDVFGSGNTLLIAGYNRYYSTNLLANKLREAMLPSYTEIRWKYHNVVQDWITIPTGAVGIYNFRDLRTPYSDEYMGGITQIILGSSLSVIYMERHNRDEFAQETLGMDMQGVIRTTLNNNGSSNYRSAQLKWYKEWKNHGLMFNTTWQQSKTSNDNYDVTFGLEEMEKIVVLDGEEILLRELPKNNFNRPIEINLAYNGRFFNHLITSAVLKYKTSFRNIEVKDSNYFLGYGEIDPITGEETKITTIAYETVKYDNSFNVDLWLAWEQIFFTNHKLTLALEIDNVFNAKNRVAGSSGTYELGRQFIAGVTYSYSR